MGSKLRLQHVATRKWLHSHAFASPLSGNQEVSCFGGPDESDTGDVWIIEWDSHNSEWKQSSKVSEASVVGRRAWLTWPVWHLARGPPLPARAPPVHTPACPPTAFRPARPVPNIFRVPAENERLHARLPRHTAAGAL